MESLDIMRSLPRGVTLEVRMRQKGWTALDTTAVTMNELVSEKATMAVAIEVGTPHEPSPVLPSGNQFLLDTDMLDAAPILPPDLTSLGSSVYNIATSLPIHPAERRRSTSPTSPTRPMRKPTPLLQEENHDLEWLMQLSSPSLLPLDDVHIASPKHSFCASNLALISRSSSPSLVMGGHLSCPLQTLPFLQVMREVTVCGKSCFSSKRFRVKADPDQEVSTWRAGGAGAVSEPRLPRRHRQFLTSLAEKFPETPFSVSRSPAGHKLAKEGLINRLLALRPAKIATTKSIQNFSELQLDRHVLDLTLFMSVNNFQKPEVSQLSWVLATLARRNNTDLLFSRLKESSGSRVYCKALALKLFRASIESEQVPLARQMLCLNAFDVNDVKMTGGLGALERACTLGNLDLVVALLDAKADPKRTHAFKSPIEAVFRSSCEKLPPNAREILTRLLRAGCQLSFQALMEGIKLHPDLVFELVTPLMDTNHAAFRPYLRAISDLWRSGLERAFRVLEEVERYCNRYHDGKCLDETLPEDEVGAIRSNDDEFFSRKLHASKISTLPQPPSIYERPSGRRMTENKWPTGATAVQMLSAIWETRDFESQDRFERLKNVEKLMTYAADNRDSTLMELLLHMFPPNRVQHPRILHQLIKLGDRDMIRQAMKLFPLSLAVDYEIEGSDELDDEMLSFLLDEKVIGSPALAVGLINAIVKDDKRLFECMLKFGASLHHSGVIYAAAEHHPRLLKVMLEAPPTPASPEMDGDMQMKLLACSLGSGQRDITSLQTLIESGKMTVLTRPHYSADFETYINPPLFDALRLCCDNLNLGIEAVVMLLKAGSDPNQVVSEDEWEGNMTPLLFAIREGCLDLVHTVLDHGAEVNRSTSLGLRKTPLQMAAEFGRLDMVNLLLDHGADVNADPAPRAGGTALQLAAISGNCNIANTFLECGANLHQPPSRVHGRCPLEGAAEHGRMDMIALLWQWATQSGSDFSDTICESAMRLAEKEGHSLCKEFIEELMREGGRSPVNHPFGYQGRGRVYSLFV